MKKGTLSFDFIVILILVVVTGLIILLMTTKLGEVILDIGEGEMCLVNAYTNAILREPVIRADLIKYRCPTKIINITLDRLRKPMTNSLQETLKNRGYTEDFSDDTEARRKYNLDAAMAYELETCWRKVGEGKLPLFSEWKLETEKWYKPEMPTFCVICSRIQFSDDDIYTDTSLSGRQLDLTTYLMRHQHKQSEDSIYVYLQDPDLELSGLFTANYSYNVDHPQAVIFARTNVLRLTQYGVGAIRLMGHIFNKDLIDEPTPVDYVAIINYEDIVDTCDILVNPNI